MRLSLFTPSDRRGLCAGLMPTFSQPNADLVLGFDGAQRVSREVLLRVSSHRQLPTGRSSEDLLTAAISLG